MRLSDPAHRRASLSALAQPQGLRACTAQERLGQKPTSHCPQKGRDAPDRQATCTRARLNCVSVWQRHVFTYVGRLHHGTPYSSPEHTAQRCCTEERPGHHTGHVQGRERDLPCRKRSSARGRRTGVIKRLQDHQGNQSETDHPWLNVGPGTRGREGRPSPWWGITEPEGPAPPRYGRTSPARQPPDRT